MFFRLNSLELALILAAIVFGAVGVGLVLGRHLRHRSEHLREPIGVLQGALLGLVGLVLAFGLALAVGRYESRRAAVVDDANAIGTTYLRAQTLAEPMRTQSIDAAAALHGHEHPLSDAVPNSAASRRRDRPTAQDSSARSGRWRARPSPARPRRARRACTSRRSTR